jgi:alpha-amylase
MDKSQYCRNGNEITPSSDNPNLLFIERGDQGFTVINKAQEPFDIKAAKMPGLQIGCYCELHCSFNINVAARNAEQKYVTQWRDQKQGGLRIGGRDALFLVQASPKACYRLSSRTRASIETVSIVPFFKIHHRTFWHNPIWVNLCLTHVIVTLDMV